MSTELKDKLATRAAARDAGIVPKDDESSVLGWLTSPATQTQIARALPSKMDAGRFARILLTEVRKNPALLTSDPQSFMLAVLNFAGLGLEPGPLGMAYLTGPFRNNKTGRKEVVPIIGYKGLCDLAYRSGTIDYIDAIAVHEGEPFRVMRGSDQRIDHEELAEYQDAPVVAYYAIAFPRGGGRAVFELMWPKDVEAIHARSRAKDSGPWQTDYEAMAKKTVIRRMLNRGKVRLSVEVAQAIAEDEATELGYERPDQLADLAALTPLNVTPPEQEAAEPADEPVGDGEPVASQNEATLPLEAGQPTDGG